MSDTPVYYRFKIEGRPVSKKNSKRIMNGRIFPSKAYMKFHDEAIPQIKMQFVGDKIYRPVRLSATFYIKGRLRQDLDNAISSIMDVLEDAGVYVDDNLVTEFGRVKKVQGKSDWSTEITIVEV